MKALIACAVILLFGCTTPETDETQTDIRSKFIGRWQGSEKNQQELGLEKHWIQERFADGRYSITFTLIWEDETIIDTEEGIWWIADGKFHEKYSGSDIPEVYNYTIIDENSMRFRLISSGLYMENPNYEFTDTKIEKQIL